MSKRTIAVIASLLAIVPFFFPSAAPVLKPRIVFAVAATDEEQPVVASEASLALTPSAEDMQQAYDAWLAEQAAQEKKRAQVQRTTGYNPCSCVTYARWKSGINVGSIGFARNHPINSHIPQVGAIMVTSESAAGHVAVVTAVNNTTLTVSEANYVRCKVSSRTLAKDSAFIRGYYFPQ